MKHFLLIPCLLLLMMSGCFACQDRTEPPVQKDEIPVVTETVAAASDADTVPKTESAEKKQETTASSEKAEPDAAAENSAVPSASDDSTESFCIATNAAGDSLLPELP